VNSRAEKGKRFLRNAGAMLSGVVLITFTALVLYSVILRYFFSAPPMWGEDIPKLMFVWMIFIGAGFAYLSGANIRMTFVIDRVRRGPRRAIELVMHFAIVAMLLVIIWYSVPILRLTSNFTSLSTGLSQGWTYWPLPLGSAMLLLNEFFRIRHLLRGGIDDTREETPHG
jgi:TRAP-type C4-dicarboxylate transport system permease small subunit